MPSRNYWIELTADERSLADEIDLEYIEEWRGDHEIFLKNGPVIIALMASLDARAALPAYWISYWTDPSCNPGRVKASRKALFQRGNESDQDIFSHPNFVSHLRFLLLGNELPAHVAKAFMQKAGNPEWVSARDAIDLGKSARRLARENQIPSHQAAEDFFKLALQMGIKTSAALVLRDALKKMR